VINAALGNRARFDAMRDFFEGVGTGHAAGVWQEVPQRRQGPKIEGPKTPIGEMA
jgi:3,8-divinyl chlorophyllide a/chlorophyllide a reductase subunit Y